MVKNENETPQHCMGTELKALILLGNTFDNLRPDQPPSPFGILELLLEHGVRKALAFNAGLNVGT